MARWPVGAVGDAIGALTGGGTSSSGGTSGSKSRSQRIPFLVEGTTSDPRFVSDVSGSVIPTLMKQLGNLKVPDPAPGQNEPSGNPLGAIKDLFKKKR